MKNTVNPLLASYIETVIIPQYENFDAAHQIDHVRSVINESLRLANFYDVNIDMVYAIAAYHDLGLSQGRATHHIVSGEIIENDKVLPSFFTKNEIRLMVEAVEDHRASIKHEPRSIYGMIVAEADRCIDTTTIIRRTIQYSLSHFPTLTKEEHYERFCEHMQEKYAEGGYLKIWLKESANSLRLKEFQQLLKDQNRTKEIFEANWNIITKQPRY